MFKFNAKFDMDPREQILGKRGLNERGRVQMFIDNEVLKLSEPYTPRKTGALSGSGRASTVIGSGLVTWNAIHSKTQYYKYGDSRRYDPLRGGHWFDRMKADHRDDIVRGSRKAAGAT